MKAFQILLVMVFSSGTILSQEGPSFSARALGSYQFFSFSGMRTNSTGFGATIEKRIEYGSTIGLNFHYITRMDEAADQKRNQPYYNDVVHFTPYFRKYFDVAFSGPYAGMGFGIGIPSDKGVQTEIGGHFGYCILQNSLVVDIGIQTGFGAFRYNEEIYGALGNYLGSNFYVDYGFFFRPSISIGFGK